MDYARHYEALYEEARGLKSQGRETDAQKVEARAAAFVEDLQGRLRHHPDDPEAVCIRLFLAERAWALVGDQASVQTQIEQALAFSEKRSGPESLDTARALAALAEFHFLAGRIGEAEPLYRRAVTVYDHLTTGDPGPRAKCHGGLAQTLAALGRSAEADPHFAQAIEHTRAEGEGKRVFYFLCLQRAEGLMQLGRQVEAETWRQKALDLLPKNNPGEFGFQV